MALKEYPLALIPLPGGLPTPTPWRNIAGPEQSCPQEAEDCDVDAANTRNTNHPSGIPYKGQGLQEVRQGLRTMSIRYGAEDPLLMRNCLQTPSCIVMLYSASP